MKAIIKATDLMFNRSVDVVCSIRKDVDAAEELRRVTITRNIRQQIVRGLKLSFGEASLELISYGRVIAEGTIRHDVFSGRGVVTAKCCSRKAA